MLVQMGPEWELRFARKNIDWVEYSCVYTKFISDIYVPKEAPPPLGLLTHIHT